MAHAVPYNYLLNVTYNHNSYAELFLTVSGLTIMVKGRGLRPIVDAIKLHTCEFIQEYDAGKFSEAADAQAPHIDSIHVEVIRGVNPAVDKDKEKG